MLRFAIALLLMTAAIPEDPGCGAAGCAGAEDSVVMTAGSEVSAPAAPLTLDGIGGSLIAVRGFTAGGGSESATDAPLVHRDDPAARHAVPPLARADRHDSPCRVCERLPYHANAPPIDRPRPV